MTLLLLHRPTHLGGDLFVTLANAQRALQGIENQDPPAFVSRCRCPVYKKREPIMFTGFIPTFGIFWSGNGRSEISFLWFGWNVLAFFVSAVLSKTIWVRLNKSIDFCIQWKIIDLPCLVWRSLSLLSILICLLQERSVFFSLFALPSYATCCC